MSRSSSNSRDQQWRQWRWRFCNANAELHKPWIYAGCLCLSRSRSEASHLHHWEWKRWRASFGGSFLTSSLNATLTTERALCSQMSRTSQTVLPPQKQWLLQITLQALVSEEWLMLHLLQIVAACSLSKGQEIFNTFGELENTELVCKYGFALPNNPFNSVHLSKSVLLELAEALIGKKQLKRRREYLEEQRYVSKSTIFKLL